MFYLTHTKEMLGFNLLKSYPNIFNFTTTRNGGVSIGNYSSLNCSYFSGDKRECVDTNWSYLLSSVVHKPRHILQPYQTHGDVILVIDQSFINSSSLQQKEALQGVDALVTNELNVLITVSTADCVPISIYDPIKKVIAVVHAGWRGTVKHILSKVISVMVERFGCSPLDILCCLGPSISLQAFEVGDEVVESFRLSGFDLNEVSLHNPTSNKYHIDLWKANKFLLLKAGIKEQHISCSHICTYERYQEFFSARRLGIKSGRIITGLQLI